MFGRMRPIDLRVEGDGLTLLRCDECVAEYAVSPDDYVWMRSSLKQPLRRGDGRQCRSLLDSIVCEGCGNELVPLKMEEHGRHDQV